MFVSFIPTVNNITHLMPLESIIALLAAMVLPILVVQEFISKSSLPRLKSLQKLLNLLTVPLLVCFVLTVGLRVYSIIERYHHYYLSIGPVP